MGPLQILRDGPPSPSLSRRCGISGWGTRAGSGDVSARAVHRVSYPARVLTQFPVQQNLRDLLQPGPVYFPGVKGGRGNNLSPVSQLPPCSGFTSAPLCPCSEETFKCQLPCWWVSDMGQAGQHLPETWLVLAALIRVPERQ